MKKVKTETRRLTGLEPINERPDRFIFLNMQYFELHNQWFAVFYDTETKRQHKSVLCPYGGKGSILWVRENWFVGKGYNDVKPIDLPRVPHLQRGYMADVEDKPEWAGRTRPCIHLPRWLSRCTLVVRDIFPQRLHPITETDAKAEGVPMGPTILAAFEKPYSEAFRRTWIKLNGLPNWELNPWVWVIKFNLKNDDNGKTTN